MKYPFILLLAAFAWLLPACQEKGSSFQAPIVRLEQSNPTEQASPSQPETPTAQETPEALATMEASFLRQFYTAYLSFETIAHRDSILAVYCTPELMKALNSAAWSFDPFINAQDFDEGLLEELTFTEDSLHTEIYWVSYQDDYRDTPTKIKMVLQANGDTFHIAGVTPQAE